MPKRELDAFTQKFTARIKATREQAKLSQDSVATILGINVTTYKHYEKRVDMPSRYLKKFAALCKVPVDSLYDDGPIPDTSTERQAIRVQSANKN